MAKQENGAIAPEKFNRLEKSGQLNLDIVI